MPMNPDDLLRALLASGQSQAPAPRRRRGGLAGIWDRNKGIIKPVVSGALGLVPGIGMGLAAGAGALMGGLDRRGKGGIGFDAGQGVRGAVEGAAAGGTARFGRGLLGRGAAGPVGADPSALAGRGSMAQNAAFEAGAQAVPEAVAPRGLAALNLRNVGSFIKENPEAVGRGLQGAAGILGSQSERRMRQQEMEMLRQRDEDERRRRQITAGLLLPLYQQQSERFRP